MKRVYYLLYILIAFFAFSCSVGKPLEKTAYVKIDNENFKSRFDLMSNKYIERELYNAYMTSFETQLAQSFDGLNIRVLTSFAEIGDSQKVFVLELNKLQFSEEFETETVYMDNLSSSPETFNVVSCGVDAYCTLFKVDSKGDKYEIRSITVNVEKDEKLSNNRTFWQVIFGSNKDNSEYNYKELNNGIVYTLCEKSARRVAGKSSRTIAKNQ